MSFGDSLDRFKYVYWVCGCFADGFAQLGTPVRFYLLSQLPSLSPKALVGVRLALIHGASVMSTAVGDAVRQKLQRDNRTVMWTGAAALLKSPDDDMLTRHDTVDLTRMRAVTQLRGLVGNTTVQPVRTQLQYASQSGSPVWPPRVLGKTIPLGQDPSGIDGYTDGTGGNNATAP